MRKQVLAFLIGIGLPVSMTTAVTAGEADVLSAEAQLVGEGTWQFTVTVKHGDEGWDHYANRFEVLGPDGSILGVRTLHHPHETEQPFTRSLGAVKIDDNVESVIVRAIDSVHESGGKEVQVPLPR